MDLINKVAQHLLGNLKVRNHAIHQRPGGHDVSRSPSNHPFGLFANGQNLIGLSIYSHHTRFVNGYAFAAYVHQSVGGTKIDTDVVRKKP